MLSQCPICQKSLPKFQAHYCPDPGNFHYMRTPSNLSQFVHALACPPFIITFSEMRGRVQISEMSSHQIIASFQCEVSDLAKIYQRYAKLKAFS